MNALWQALKELDEDSDAEKKADKQPPKTPNKKGSAEHEDEKQPLMKPNNKASAEHEDEKQPPKTPNNKASAEHEDEKQPPKTPNNKASAEPEDEKQEPNKDANVENGNVNKQSGSAEQTKSKNMAFNNASIRAGFVRKVFAIVTIMILVDIAMVASVVALHDVRVYINSHRYFHWVALGIFIVTYGLLMCCSPLARNCPWNVILLTIFTLSAGCTLMVAVAYVPPYTVFMALGTTAVTCFAIILFAAQTKWDITSNIFIIYVVGAVLCIFGIAVAIVTIFVYIRWLHIVLSAIACIFFMVHLAVDIQMILGGRKYEISPEDYIYAALRLFIDIYEIFMNLLNLFQGD